MSSTFPLFCHQFVWTPLTKSTWVGVDGLRSLKWGNFHLILGYWLFLLTGDTSPDFHQQLAHNIAPRPNVGGSGLGDCCCCWLCHLESRGPSEPCQPVRGWQLLRSYHRDVQHWTELSRFQGAELSHFSRLWSWGWAGARWKPLYALNIFNPIILSSWLSFMWSLLLFIYKIFLIYVRMWSIHS